MFYKKRDQPIQLEAMESLRIRKRLTAEEEQYHSSLAKGYDGEQWFDGRIEQLTCDCLILNDLLLKVNRTVFQIDTLIIKERALVLYEVKNHEGEYSFEKEQLIKKDSGRKVLNPVIQLARSKTLISQLAADLGSRLPVQAYIAFVNPRFTLYQAPLDQNLLLPTLLESHFEQLNKTPSRLTSSHKRLAQQLCTLHLPESPYRNLPAYEYEELRKGVFCLKCQQLLQPASERIFLCPKCGHKETGSETLFRHIRDYQLLFPERLLTTRMIQDFCGQHFSEKRIRTVLQRNFTKKGAGRGVHYS